MSLQITYVSHAWIADVRNQSHQSIDMYDYEITGLIYDSSGLARSNTIEDPALVLRKVTIGPGQVKAVRASFYVGPCGKTPLTPGSYELVPILKYATAGSVKYGSAQRIAVRLDADWDLLPAR